MLTMISTTRCSGADGYAEDACKIAEFSNVPSVFSATVHTDAVLVTSLYTIMLKNAY